MKRVLAIVVVVGAIVSGLGSGSALAVTSICDSIPGNLVKNCGFEKSDFTDWDTIAAASGSDFGVRNASGAFVHSGDYAAFFGATGTLDDIIKQTLPTTFGSQYTVTFFLHNANGGLTPNNDFKAFWNAIPLVALVNAPDFGYTEFTSTQLGTGSDVIKFAGRNANASYFLDDVSVAAVPEPATLFLLGSGLAGLAAWRRRQS